MVSPEAAKDGAALLASGERRCRDTEHRFPERHADLFREDVSRSGCSSMLPGCFSPLILTSASIFLGPTPASPSTSQDGALSANTRSSDHVVVEPLRSFRGSTGGHLRGEWSPEEANCRTWHCVRSERGSDHPAGCGPSPRRNHLRNTPGPLLGSCPRMAGRRSTPPPSRDPPA